MIRPKFKVGQAVYYLSQPFSANIANLRKGTVTSITITSCDITYEVDNDSMLTPCFATKQELKDYYIKFYKELYEARVNRLIEITNEEETNEAIDRHKEY